MSCKNLILGISSITLATGLTIFLTKQVHASEISLDSQVNIKPKFLKNTKQLPDSNLHDRYTIARKDLDLKKFCINYPYNSLCKNKNANETDGELETPILNSANQLKGDNWAILTTVSTLGLGGAVVAKISPKLNVRVGLNSFSFNVDYEETRASYDSDVNLFNITTALDYYPFKNLGFSASLGAIYNNNNADGVAMAADVVDIDLGLFNVNVNDLLNVNAKVSTSNNFAPYVGVGWGNPIVGGLRFWGNLGVMFPGSPEVELTPDFQFNEDLIPGDIKQDIQNSLDDEEESIENNLERFNMYPVISIGLSYSF